jgi:hypothetical protein
MELSDATEKIPSDTTGSLIGTIHCGDIANLMQVASTGLAITLGRSGRPRVFPDFASVFPLPAHCVLRLPTPSTFRGRRVSLRCKQKCWEYCEGNVEGVDLWDCFQWSHYNSCLLQLQIRMFIAFV